MASNIKKIVVNVTAEQIAKSRKDAWRRNPVALALRAAGFRYVYVSSYFKDFAEVSKSSRGLALFGQPTGTIELPKKVKKLLEAYENASSRKELKKLRPVSFVVKVTPDIAPALKNDPITPVAVSA